MASVEPPVLDSAEPTAREVDASIFAACGVARGVDVRDNAAAKERGAEGRRRRTHKIERGKKY